MKNSNDNASYAEAEEEFAAKKVARGPKGLGDPADRTLRKVEKEVMIPKIVRERSKTLKCADEKKAFDQCCLDTAMAHVFKCREENRQYQQCMAKWFFDENFVKECKEIYLKQRAEFRTSGVKKQMKPKNPSSSKPDDQEQRQQQKDQPSN